MNETVCGNGYLQADLIDFASNSIAVSVEACSVEGFAEFVDLDHRLLPSVERVRLTAYDEQLIQRSGC